jgi:hypothetical protein
VFRFFVKDKGKMGYWVSYDLFFYLGYNPPKPSKRLRPCCTLSVVKKEKMKRPVRRKVRDAHLLGFQTKKKMVKMREPFLCEDWEAGKEEKKKG